MVDLDELGKQQLDRIASAPKKFLDYVQGIEDKRPKFVIDEILKNGYCTMETLEQHYAHGPRAARDVREKGIQLDTAKYRASNGRALAVYFFGSFDFDVMSSKTNGRSALSNALKEKLIKQYGSKCFIFLEELPANKLQVDHRVPYEIAGEQDENNCSNFMLLSAAANRRKSWECEHCPNWTIKDVDRCNSCFWAHPEASTHTACRRERQIAFVIKDEKAIIAFDSLVKSEGLNAVLDLLGTNAKDFLISKAE